MTSPPESGPATVPVSSSPSPCGRAGPIHLTPLEYRVLEPLARKTGMIVMQNQLLREVWGPDRLDDTRSLRVCMRNLRQKLEVDPSRPRHLMTEPGLGYRLLSG